MDPKTIDAIMFKMKKKPIIMLKYFRDIREENP